MCHEVSHFVTAPLNKNTLIYWNYSPDHTPALQFDSIILDQEPSATNISSFHCIIIFVINPMNHHHSSYVPITFLVHDILANTHSEFYKHFRFFLKDITNQAFLNHKLEMLRKMEAYLATSKCRRRYVYIIHYTMYEYEGIN